MSWSIRRYFYYSVKKSVFTNSNRIILFDSENLLFKHAKYSTFADGEFGNANLAENPSPNHLEVLKNKFGHDNFKPYQWSIVQSVIENGRDNYICLPTGYGKSLCYQYPAVFFNKLAIVVSPLISLMQDQVRILEKNNIKSCFIANIQSNRHEIIEKLLNGFYNMLYITPESITNDRGLQLLYDLYNSIPISLIAIDEAQCIIHWGKDFRPSFQKLNVFRLNMPSVPIMALTASATDEEKIEIIKQLGLRDPKETLHNYDRANLYFMTKKMSGEPYGDILSVMKEDASKRKISDGSMIVYCLTKKKTVKIAKLLNSMGIECQVYHADLSAENRMKTLNDFMNNKIKVIIATTAFGLGVNKNNVRIVIHYGTSMNLENYFQEVGRAGRDGEPALCVVFYSIYDFFIHGYLNKNKTPNHIKALGQNEDVNTMKKYVLLNSCRRHFILSHFQNIENDDNAYKENCCDNCTQNLNSVQRQMIDCTYEVELFLQAIKSLQPLTFGLRTIISLLRGRMKRSIVEAFNKNKYYGVGGNKDEEWWKNLALMLESENYVKITGKMVNSIFYTKTVLDEKGNDWLNRKSKGIVEPIFIKNI